MHPWLSVDQYPQLIPHQHSIKTGSTLNQHLDWHLADNRSTLDQFIDPHLTDSQSIWGQLLINSYMYQSPLDGMSKKISHSWPTADQDVNHLSIECQSKCWSSVDQSSIKGLDQGSATDAFSMYMILDWLTLIKPVVYNAWTCSYGLFSLLTGLQLT